MGILDFPPVSLMVPQVTAASEMDGSAADMRLLEPCLHCCEGAKGK